MWATIFDKTEIPHLQGREMENFWCENIETSQRNYVRFGELGEDSCRLHKSYFPGLGHYSCDSHPLSEMVEVSSTIHESPSQEEAVGGQVFH
jgi:hypothetical protein